MLVENDGQLIGRLSISFLYILWHAIQLFCFIFYAIVLKCNFAAPGLQK